MALPEPTVKTVSPNRWLSGTRLSLFLHSRPIIAVASLFLIACVGFIDYHTGNELTISIFYLVPIFWGTWFIGRYAGIFLSIVSVVVEMWVLYKDGIFYSHPLIFYWNGFGKLGFFLIFAHLLNVRKRIDKELRQTVQELDRSNNDLEQFASVAAHDLKAPLRTISTYLQLLQQRYSDGLNSKANEIVSTVCASASRMHTLINNLLSYSYVGNGCKPSQSVHSADALNKALENLKSAIDENGAQITSDPLPDVMVVESEWIQLFQNLIGNAVKFRSQKTPRIHISATREERGWLFSVKDNGVGIERQYTDRIFEIFERLHTEEEYPGTGIGLALCKKIVESHGGKIWVESNPGEGSIFYFYLPV
ncbi:MAG: PAS domain-containing sensor histidine kinase [Elusimicrobia bacterium]|nr:PAS domain-containing sensor histidine kinase [Candidatus Obscuribacterium magneticum]